MIVVIGVLVLINILLIVVKVLLFFFFLLGLQILIVRIVIGDFLAGLHLGIWDWFLIAADIWSSYHSRLSGYLLHWWLIVAYGLVVESIRLISRFVSSYLNFSSLVVCSPFSDILGIILLQVGIRSSYNGTLHHWIIAWLSLVSSGLLILVLGISGLWRLKLVLRVLIVWIVLWIIVLHITLGLLNILSLLERIGNFLAVLIIGNGCLSWSLSLLSLQIKVVGIVNIARLYYLLIDLFFFCLTSLSSLNTMSVHKVESQIRVFVQMRLNAIGKIGVLAVLFHLSHNGLKPWLVKLSIGLVAFL